MMKCAYLAAVLALAIATLASAYGVTISFTVGLDSPPNGQDITGNGWQNPCVANGNTCGGYCASQGAGAGQWEAGYYFDSTIVGSATCTLTLKATAFDVTNTTGPNQTGEVLEAQVNGVAFDRTIDICTGANLSCACNVATRVSTKTVSLAATGNWITVMRPDDDVAVKGATLTCTAEVTSCTPGYIDQYQCSSNWRQRSYQKSDCSTEWRNFEYCSYGCAGGACRPYPNSYCTDTDGGILFGTQGNTYGTDAGLTYSKSDYCSGNTLNEYYCNGTIWNVTAVDCTGSCSNGRCLDIECTNECSMLNLRECHSSGYRICGYYDTDSCLDWSYTPCGSNEDCDDGYCVGGGNDECGGVGWENDYRCSGNWQQRLYTFDDNGDCEEEWRNYDYCSEGCSNEECEGNTCGNGICSGGETCSNCPADCGTCQIAYCGNGICSGGETCSNCPADCGTCPIVAYCGNGICGSGETCLNCQVDCGTCAQVNYCGNGICNNGETCASCQVDCGVCDTCGDGFCTGVETCSTCQRDCGLCIIAQGVLIGNDIEVSATAHTESGEAGTELFDLAIYNREDHEAVYSIRLTGEASPWSSVVPGSLRIPARMTAIAQIRVVKPANLEDGTYSLTAIISSGGEDIIERRISVVFAEPVESDDEPAVAASPQNPTGAIVIGEAELIWALIAFGAAVNIALAYVLIKKRRV